MRSNSPILLFLPLLDLVCLLPMQRLMGVWLWPFLAASALLGLGLLKLARRGVEPSARGLLSGRHLSLMIESQPTVMAGLLFAWPGIFSDLAAIMLLLSAPVPITQSGADHPRRFNPRS